jgi:hypothetical protein
MIISKNGSVEMLFLNDNEEFYRALKLFQDFIPIMKPYF